MKVHIDTDVALKAYNEKNPDAQVSKEGLAKLVGTNPQNLKNYHAGRVPQVLHVAFNLSLLTGLSIDELIKEKDEN